MIEDIEGERGNPWVRPHNPSRMNLSDSDSGAGTGWGCGAHGGLPSTRAFVLYRFNPNRSGTWHVMPRIDFAGFYRYHANDKIYNCKSVSVRLDVDVRARQYGNWHSQIANYRIFKKGGSNVNNYGMEDNAYGFPMIEHLRADPCWIAARITLDADARGNGSWAEINFKSGSANYINPWHMAAKYLHP